MNEEYKLRLVVLKSFVPGLRVRHGSLNGPPMVVIENNEPACASSIKVDPVVHCQWYNKVTGEFPSKWFDLCTVVKED